MTETDATILARRGLTPRRRVNTNGSTTRSELFRLRVDGELTKSGVLKYVCPHCGGKGAFRPPEWACPNMVVQTETLCCDHAIVLHISGRTPA